MARVLISPLGKGPAEPKLNSEDYQTAVYKFDNTENPCYLSLKKYTWEYKYSEYLNKKRTFNKLIFKI